MKVHDDKITSICMHPKNKMMFATSSMDKTVVIYETKTLKPLKTFRSTIPLNSCSISPLRKHIIYSGGTQARDVTTSFHTGHTFDIEFGNMVFEEKIGSVKGHFGTVHAVQFSPDGKSFVSGGEDGMIRINPLTDKEYWAIQDEPTQKKDKKKI